MEHLWLLILLALIFLWLRWAWRKSRGWGIAIRPLAFLLYVMWAFPALGIQIANWGINHCGSSKRRGRIKQYDEWDTQRRITDENRDKYG